MKKIFNGIQKIKQYLNEVKATSLTVGETFTLSGDIGNFKEGEKVSVDDILPFGNDVELHLSNSKGVKDTFYLDINDDFEQLVPEAKRLQKLAGIVNEQDEEVPQETSDEPTPEEAPTPETPPGSINKEQAEQLIRDTKGKFFTVTFIKKDGTTRVMNARLGVKAYLKGGELPYDAAAKGLIPVFDIPKRAYRIVNLNTITNLKIGNNEYNVL
jgi:hypothetical protein